MKRKITLAIFCLTYLCACKTDPLVNLPVFNFRLSDSSTIVSTRDIPEDRPIVVIYFDTDCRDCQQTTDSLLQNMGSVKNVRFYFFTMEKISQVTLFRDYYKLDLYPNITIGQDYTRFLPKHFNNYSTPLIALYTPNKKLVGIYRGKPNSIKTLINSIQSIH